MQDDDRPAGAGRAIEDAAARLKAGTSAGDPEHSPGLPDRPGETPAEIPDDTPGGPQQVPPEMPDDPAVPQRDIPDQAGADAADPGDDPAADPEDGSGDPAETVGDRIDRDRPLPL